MQKYFLILGMLIFPLIFANCIYNEEWLRTTYPFCNDVGLNNYPFIQHVNTALGGHQGLTFLSCSLRYWRRAHFWAHKPRESDVLTLLIDPQTGHVSSGFLNGGVEVYGGAWGDILDKIKDAIVASNKPSYHVEFYADEAIEVNGIRLVAPDSNSTNWVYPFRTMRSYEDNVYIPGWQLVEEEKYVKGALAWPE